MRSIYASLLLLSILFVGCDSNKNHSEKTNSKASIESQSFKTDPIQWESIYEEEIALLNSELTLDALTMDLGVYWPSNFDPNFRRTSLPKILEGIKEAQRIFAAVDVQINVLWIKTGKVDPEYFSIRGSEPPNLPNSPYVNMYVNMQRDPATPSAEALQAFESIVEPHPDNPNTLYLVALQEVYFSFYEPKGDGRTHTLQTLATSGLSFPPYMYSDNIPKRIRGVFTITGLEGDDFLKTIAHEIGHKTINVSHEYRSIAPAHEVREEGGLMIYGKGVEIPSGEDGRWHKERLHVSPFLYRKNDSGAKVWNDDYLEGGHYYDPVYDTYSIKF